VIVIVIVVVTPMIVTIVIVIVTIVIVIATTVHVIVLQRDILITICDRTLEFHMYTHMHGSRLSHMYSNLPNGRNTITNHCLA